MSSFATDINTVLTSDPSLNAWIDGGIHYQNLLDNWLAETDNDLWVVYEFNKDIQTNCLNSKNVFMTYSMQVVLIQRGANNQIDIITDRLLSYLNNYESGNIIDIAFIRDQGGFNQQQNTYTNTLEFQCTYIEN